MAKAKYDPIGEMDRRIQLQTYTETTNTYGERIETYSAVATLWAKVEYLGTEGIEAERSGRQTWQAKVNFTIRNRAITERVRVIFDGRTWDIEGTAVSQDKQFITLRCQQIGTGAFI
jgi:SPP1 family predicted phage head-tail adaptor